MKNTKKQFQQVIGSIRNDINEADGTPNRKYPKPMMTIAQMDKGEATVNCGGEWGTPESTKRLADAVLADARFEAFITSKSARAAIERNNFNTYQIRIKF